MIHGEPETFLTIGSALFEHKRVQISYYSRTRRAESFREISAQRLVHYRNYWYVDAFCHATNALRTFAIDNIRRVIVLGTTAKRVPLHTIEYNLDQSYGLFMSGDPKLAVLRFDAEASALSQARDVASEADTRGAWRRGGPDGSLHEPDGTHRRHLPLARARRRRGS